MTPLDKLIENAGWRPISEAPKDGARIIARRGNLILGVRWGKRNYNHNGNGWRGWTGNTNKGPTHFMPLDTPERMAEVIKVLYEALASVKCDMYDSTPLPDDVCEEVEQALAKANDIAGRE